MEGPVSIRIAEIVLFCLQLYGGAGLLFAIPFVLFGVQRIDPGAHWEVNFRKMISDIGLRLLIIPGTALLIFLATRSYGEESQFEPLVGFQFTIPFLLLGVQQLDPGELGFWKLLKGTGLRILLIPGLTLVWILCIRAYGMTGLQWAIPFILFGVQRIDPGERGFWTLLNGIIFRILIIPGLVIFWPLFALRLRQGKGKPTEYTAHRFEARKYHLRSQS